MINSEQPDEITALRAQLAAKDKALGLAKDALTELVSLKDQKTKLQQLHEEGYGTDYTNYYERKPAAWAAARAALLAIKEAQS